MNFTNKCHTGMGQVTGQVTSRCWQLAVVKPSRLPHIGLLVVHPEMLQIRPEACELGVLATVLACPCIVAIPDTRVLARSDPHLGEMGFEVWGVGPKWAYSITPHTSDPDPWSRVPLGLWTQTHEYIGLSFGFAAHNSAGVGVCCVPVCCFPF